MAGIPDKYRFTVPVSYESHHRNQFLCHQRYRHLHHHSHTFIKTNNGRETPRKQGHSLRKIANCNGRTLTRVRPSGVYPAPGREHCLKQDSVLLEATGVHEKHTVNRKTPKTTRRKSRIQRASEINGTRIIAAPISARNSTNPSSKSSAITCFVREAEKSYVQSSRVT